MLPKWTADTLSDGTLLDRARFRVDCPLGSGGFGKTYLATRMADGEVVAIKEFYPFGLAARVAGGAALMPTNGQAKFDAVLARFMREGNVLRTLDHPNIVKVFSIFADNNTAYLEMPCISNTTLRKELCGAPDGRLAEARIIALFAQLVDALALVHASGLVHLDIKPDNVMVAGDGRPVLIDFGAAKRTASSVTGSTRIGSPHYAPPEIADLDERLTAESDIYEMGVMLYEVLMGELPPPFNGTRRQAGWTPRAVPEAWRMIVTEALHYHQTERPGDIRGWWAMAPSQQRWDVQVLAIPPEDKHGLVMLIHQLAGRSLMDAMAFVEHLPQAAATGVSREEAERMQRALEAEGARVAIIGHGPCCAPPGDDTPAKAYRLILQAIHPARGEDVARCLREDWGMTPAEARRALGALPYVLLECDGPREVRRRKDRLVRAGASAGVWNRERDAWEEAPEAPAPPPIVKHFELVLTAMHAGRREEALRQLRLKMGLSPAEAERMAARCPAVIGRCDDALEADLLKQQLEEGGLLAVGLREKGADAWTLPPRALPTAAPARRVELVLDAIDAEHMVEVAMLLCEILQYGRKEALHAVDSLPYVLWIFADESEARRARERLEFARMASVGLREAGAAAWLLPPTALPPPPPPPPAFALRLLSVEPARQAGVITAVRSLLALSAADARRLVEGAPAELGRFPDLAVARDIKHQLEREGAAVAVVNAATGETIAPPAHPAAPRSAGMARVGRALLTVGSLALIGLTAWHYVQAGGAANILGAILWSVLMLVFALGMGLVTADTVIRLRGVNGARRGIAATMLALGVPALGLLNTRQHPASFFAGWFVVFGLGLAIWVVASIIAPTAETADGEADVPSAGAPKDDAPTPGGRAVGLESQVKDLLDGGKW